MTNLFFCLLLHINKICVLSCLLIYLEEDRIISVSIYTAKGYFSFAPNKKCEGFKFPILVIIHTIYSISNTSFTFSKAIAECLQLCRINFWHYGWIDEPHHNSERLCISSKLASNYSNRRRKQTVFWANFYPNTGQNKVTIFWQC